MDLTGKVAVVTGGAQGIGDAVARKIAELGGKSAILDINQAAAEACAARLKDAGLEVMAVAVDITKKDQVVSAIAKIMEKYGSTDIVVNNAGYTEGHKFVDEEESYWDKLLSINLKGAFLVTQAALKNMIEKNSGKIVNIASDSCRIGNPGEAVYSATKAGLVAFTKSLAREVARYNINVNCVSPGPTNTPLMAAQPPNMIEGLKKIIPLRRIGEPVDIANMVAYLCAPEANFITGQIISVSGGLTMVG